MAAPNFLIIGDLKAGTTSLHYYLSQHPEICMPKIKELRYFAYDCDNPYHNIASTYRIKTYDEYLKRFNHCKNGKIIGEASPNYLRSTGAASRIKNKLPDVKIIVSLRNPADRLYSLYMMNCRTNDIKIPFIEQAFRHNASWIKSNFYWNELKNYYDLFDKDRIKVIIFDELKSNTIDIIKDLYKFLGVDVNFIPNIEVHNKGGLPKNTSIYMLLSFMEGQLKKIATPPMALTTLWKKIKRLNLIDSKMDPETRKKILEVFIDDIYRTQDLIERDLSIWLK